MARTTYTCGSRSVSEDKITEQIFTQEKPQVCSLKFTFALNTGVCGLCLVRVLVGKGTNQQSCAVLEAVFLDRFAAGLRDAWFPT